jgi:hypothetical protein
VPDTTVMIQPGVDVMDLHFGQVSGHSFALEFWTVLPTKDSNKQVSYTYGQISNSIFMKHFANDKLNRLLRPVLRMTFSQL